ncbi:hypothetical protein Snoj_00750 [Streptomyces nojiriensis]|uniref:Uncharacterized protein n=1 Tax=Streptomyces nojiriensis TaxID=66374 RepID=A0ABQ3SDL8_9ACTN|nr:hypothetical protein JYK04_00058 [Streptomyces nojiriensis]GGS34644.1 hypothetical protein GCM10010205_76040 [Streptomyces nojiriensis]GHI66157.1 hypothetical protein Snoj_00750 [Streptomyces nojiriensis]
MDEPERDRLPDIAAGCGGTDAEFTPAPWPKSRTADGRGRGLAQLRDVVSRSIRPEGRTPARLGRHPRLRTELTRPLARETCVRSRRR